MVFPFLLIELRFSDSLADGLAEIVPESTMFADSALRFHFGGFTERRFHAWLRLLRFRFTGWWDWRYWGIAAHDRAPCLFRHVRECDVSATNAKNPLPARYCDVYVVPAFTAIL